MTPTQIEALKKIKRWREDPVQFVRDNFKCEPDLWQADALMALVNNQRIAMKACKGPGKTCILAWAAWWFLTVFPHPKIAATSISGANLADGLWTEMSKWQQRSEFLKATFVWTKTRIFAKDHPTTWWMSARTWREGADPSQQANTLAGFHADYLLFILDEVGGIPDAVMAAAEAGLATGKVCKILMAGNPTHLTGPLYRACTSERSLWFVIEITSDPDDPKRTPRVSKKWAREQIQKYGRDNPFVLVNVFGKFPPSSMNSLLGPDEVEAAMNRHYSEDKYIFVQKRLGVDVARFGDDLTVLFPRQGLVAFQPSEMRKARNPEIAARVLLAESRWHQEIEIVDGTGGFGGGVIDCLLQAGRNPFEYQASGLATDPRYYNKRAEVQFAMAEWVKKGGALPDIPQLKAEMTATTYTTKNGKFIIEPKELIKKKLNGMSPDYSDALSMTFIFPDLPAKKISNFSKPNHVSEYDPFNQPED